MSFEIERLDAGSASPERLAERGAPAVVAGLVGEAERVGRWSPEALRSAAGGRAVSVAKSETALFGFTDEGIPRHEMLGLSLAEALDLILGADDAGPFYYIRRAKLTDLGLAPEGLPAAVLTEGEGKSHSLWLGSAGCVTPLHYDSESNLLAQLHGAKEVTLIPPTEHARLYPYAMTDAPRARKSFLYSRADPETLDVRRFPDFPAHLAVRFTLLPGETLYVPPFWWHRVRSPEVAVSANLFWGLRPRQCLVAASLDYLRFRYRRDTLANFFADEPPAHRPLSFLRLAAEAESLGLHAAASILCGAAARLILHTPDSTDTLTADDRKRAESTALLAGITAATAKSPTPSNVRAAIDATTALASRHCTLANTPHP